MARTKDVPDVLLGILSWHSFLAFFLGILLGVPQAKLVLSMSISTNKIVLSYRRCSFLSFLCFIQHSTGIFDSLDQRPKRLSIRVGTVESECVDNIVKHRRMHMHFCMHFVCICICAYVFRGLS